jgi:hypothetical protein
MLLSRRPRYYQQVGQMFERRHYILAMSLLAAITARSLFMVSLPACRFRDG